MITIGGRVAVEIEVDEELFRKNPQEAITQAIADGRAIVSGGDNYLPESWNEGIIEDDMDFETPLNTKLKRG